MVVLTADNNESGFFLSLDPFFQASSTHSVHENDSPWFFFGNEEAKVLPSELTVIDGSGSNEPISCIHNNEEHSVHYQLQDGTDDLPIYGIPPVLPDATTHTFMVRHFHTHLR